METIQTQKPGSQEINHISPVHIQDPDEINLLEYIYAIVKHKRWLILAVIIGLVGGYGLALKKGRTYVSEAVIAAKESENQKSPNLSAFGAFSGMVASQLNIAGNPGLDKIDLILDSRKFNAEMIDSLNLLPSLYKVSNPKIFNKMYDTIQKVWKPEFKKPEILGMGGAIKGFLKKTTNKNNTMTLKIESKDSTFSKMVLNSYLFYLNKYIQAQVVSEAKENIVYLDKQLMATGDPLLREKLQGLIANEVEKQMLVSKEAFKIIDPPFASVQFKEKKLYPMVFSFGLFFLTMMIIVFGHAFSTGPKTEEDVGLIEGIKKEIFKI